MSAPHASELPGLDPSERATLQTLGFRERWFSPLAAELRAGRRPRTTATGEITPPFERDLCPLPAVGTQPHKAHEDAGGQWLSLGRVAVLLLNGGMATRFGGVVKGTVDALPGRSFLQLQAERIRTLQGRYGAPIPLLLMNSLATDGPTRAHFQARGHFGLDPAQISMFVQGVAPRLRLDGTLFRDAAGQLSLYGPGHGDLFPAAVHAGVVPWLKTRGVEHVLVANVDNLGASLDAAVLGAALALDEPLVVEVAPKKAGDAGGCPVRLEGRPVLLEGFAFPRGFDTGAIDVFNTNTLWFRTEALGFDPPLWSYAVEKEHEGQAVVQFERLVGQASWFLPTRYLRVGRDRFLPVKSPEDLDALRPELLARFPRLRVLG